MARTAPAVAEFPIDWGLEPEAAENPRTIRAWVTVEAALTFQLNLENQVSREILSNIQSLYIDNSDGANPVQIVAGKTRQNLTIPQGCQAYLPFLFGDDFIIEITRADAGRIPLWFVNMPMPAIVWSTEAAGAVVSISGGVITSITDPVDVVIDDSTPIEVSVQQPVETTEVGAATGTLSTVTGTGASISVLAANANRKGASVNNLSGVSVSLRLEAAAASAANATVTLAAGQYYETPFGYTGEIRGIWASGNITVTEFV